MNKQEKAIKILLRIQHQIEERLLQAKEKEQNRALNDISEWMKTYIRYKEIKQEGKT